MNSSTFLVKRLPFAPGKASGMEPKVPACYRALALPWEVCFFIKGRGSEMIFL